MTGSMLAAPWAPRGLISEAHLTANATSTSASTTFIDVVGTVSTDNGAGVGGATLQVACGVLAGRRYRLLAAGNFQTDTAGDVAGFQGVATLTAGGVGAFVGVLSGQSNVDLRTTSFFNLGEAPGYFYCTTTGTLTVKLQVHRTTGAGTITVGSQSGLAVYDEGLSP